MAGCLPIKSNVLLVVWKDYSMSPGPLREVWIFALQSVTWAIHSSLARLSVPWFIHLSLDPCSVDRLPGVSLTLTRKLPAMPAWHLSAHTAPISVCVRRYLFALQVKQDLAQGRLMCNDTSAALLISHIVQCKFCWFALTCVGNNTVIWWIRGKAASTKNSSNAFVLFHWWVECRWVENIPNFMYYMYPSNMNPWILCSGVCLSFSRTSALKIVTTSADSKKVRWMVAK